MEDSASTKVSIYIYNYIRIELFHPKTPALNGASFITPAHSVMIRRTRLGDAWRLNQHEHVAWYYHGPWVKKAAVNTFVWSKTSPWGTSWEQTAVLKYRRYCCSDRRVVFLRASAMLKHVIDIGWTFVRLSVCLSVRHTLARYQNGWICCHAFFTTR